MVDEFINETEIVLYTNQYWLPGVNQAQVALTSRLSVFSKQTARALGCQLQGKKGETGVAPLNFML